jgi:hypothetical protein
LNSGFINHRYNTSCQEIERCTLDDRLPDLESLRPEEEGVGVVGMSIVKSAGSDATGEASTAASELTADGDGTAEEDEEVISSSVLGTYTHRFNPSESFAFLHLLPILSPVAN